MTKQRNTRRFNYDGPIAYQGSLYPSTQMDIEDDKGNVSSRNVFADARGQYYTLNEDGNAIPIVLQNNLDEVTVTPTPRQATAEERRTNLQKQAMMRAAGYNVPMDGSWGAYQEAIWHNLTTKPKEYDNTLTGFAEGLIDRYNGTTTERTNPLYQGDVKTYNPDNIDWGKTRRSQSNAIKQLEGTYGPIVAMATMPELYGAAISAPIATIATLGGGAVGGYAVNKASEALTGRDFGTNVAIHTPLTPSMGEMLNPGYAVGGYGTERRMLDAIYNQVTPLGYQNVTGINGSLPKTKELQLAIQDFFTPKRIKTSVNDTPAWQQRINAFNQDSNVDLVSLLRDDAWRLAMRQKPRTIDINGEPHSLYVKNPDGTYKYDFDYINKKREDAGFDPLEYETFRILNPTSKGLHEGLNKVVAGDSFGYNGGNIGAEINLPKNWKGIQSQGSTSIRTSDPIRIYDKWDLQFLQDPNRSLLPAFSRWLTRHPNKVTNYIRNIDAAQAVGGNPFMLDMQIPRDKFGFLMAHDY